MKAICFAATLMVTTTINAGSALAADPANFADDLAISAVTEQLTGQGYTVTDVERTLLGRLKIEATIGDYGRELVYSTKTGEILRDVSVRLNLVAAPIPIIDPRQQTLPGFDLPDGGFTNGPTPVELEPQIPPGFYLPDGYTPPIAGGGGGGVVVSPGDITGGPTPIETGPLIPPGYDLLDDEIPPVTGGVTNGLVTSGGS